jgi:hypothetical protein
MRTGLSSIASVVLLTIACRDGAERRFTLPTAPVATPAPTGPPASAVPAPPPYVQPPLPPVHPTGHRMST